MPEASQGGLPARRGAVAGILGTLAGAETFTDIARFGEKKLALLRRFRPFKDGTPPHDRIGDIFATLDAEQFQHCFVAWVASVTGLPEGVIAIDGRRAPVGRKWRKAPSTWLPLPLANAWCSDR